jgi:hypothetical protein
MVFGMRKEIPHVNPTLETSPLLGRGVFIGKPPNIPARISGVAQYETGSRLVQVSWWDEGRRREEWFALHEVFLTQEVEIDERE